MKSFVTSIARLSVTVLTHILFIPVLWAIEPFWRFRFGEVFEARVGHLAIDFECYARTQQFEPIPRRTTHIFLVWNPANQQLMKMWKRHLCIIESRWLRWASFTFMPILEETRFYLEYNRFDDAADILSLGRPVLRFTEEEEKLGREKLREMGIGPDDWFACFHSRDPSYLHTRKTATPTGFHRSMRDTSISNMTDAMQWVVEQGGYAIRMGAITETELPIKGQGLIDYPNHFRSDFMDIYLSAKCRFFIGSTSGLICVPVIFGTPAGMANNVPIHYQGLGMQSFLLLPKFAQCRNNGSILTFLECKERGLFEYTDRTLRMKFNDSFYDNIGIDWIENSALDILEFTQDLMDMTISEDPPHAKEARRLQAAYRALLTRDFATPLGPRFALRYKDLILGGGSPGSGRAES